MILKFQSGGLTAPWVLYTPLSINTASPRTSTGESSKKSSSKGDSDSGKLTEKDLLGILKEMKVLPSDSKLILPKLERFIRLQDIGDTVDPAAIAIQFIRSLQEIKNAEYRRAAFEEAYKKVEKEGGLNEFAVNVSGELAVLNKENGEISFVTLDNLDNLDTLNYRPLTNSDVLRLRAEEFGNADALTQLASNGVGMEKISQRINTLFHTLGKDEISNDGYTRSPEAHVMNLLRSKVLEIKSSTNNEQVAQELYDAARLQIGEGISLKGLYKYTESNGTSNRQLGEALQYIYNGLLPNERTILDLRSGGKKGDGIKAITHMLISTSSTNYKFDLDMLENENGVKPGTKESADTLKINVVSQFIKGYGPKERFVFQDGTPEGMVLTVSSLPITNNGTEIGVSTAKDLFGSDYGRALDPENISIAGQLISPSNLNHIIQHGRAYNVDMPLDLEQLAKGNKVPDLDLMRKKKEADKIIEDEGYTSVNDKNRVYQEKGLPIKYNNDGTINTTSWATFAAINVDAYSGVFPDLDGITFSRYATELTGTEEDSTVSLINQLNDKAGALDYDKKDLPWEGRGHWYLNPHDAIYKSTMWIPVYDNVVTTLGAATQEQLNKAEALDAENERRKTLSERIETIRENRER